MLEHLLQLGDGWQALQIDPSRKNPLSTWHGLHELSSWSVLPGVHVVQAGTPEHVAQLVPQFSQTSPFLNWLARHGSQAAGALPPASPWPAMQALQPLALPVQAVQVVEQSPHGVVVLTKYVLPVQGAQVLEVSALLAMQLRQ